MNEETVEKYQEKIYSSAGLFHIHMRILFPFLLAEDINRFLLLTRTPSFYSPLRRGYMRKVSVHLVQNIST